MHEFLKILFGRRTKPLYRDQHFVRKGSNHGEIVFIISMTGYLEVLTICSLKMLCGAGRGGGDDVNHRMVITELSQIWNQGVKV